MKAEDGRLYNMDASLSDAKIKDMQHVWVVLKGAALTRVVMRPKRSSVHVGLCPPCVWQAIWTTAPSSNRSPPRQSTEVSGRGIGWPVSSTPTAHGMAWFSSEKR